MYLSGFSQWDYYVTMSMPASTFTIAVGTWQEAKTLPDKHEEWKEDGRSAELEW